MSFVPPGVLGELEAISPESCPYCFPDDPCALHERTDVARGLTNYRQPTIGASPFPWFGGKQALAKRIVELLPSHTTYIEAFGGGASVLFTKSPAHLEVYNDRDSGLVTFFRCLRDRADELIDLLWLTPFSREEFGLAADWADADDELERARRWYARVAQAYAGTPTYPGWSADKMGRSNGSRSQSFARRIDRLHRFAERLRYVQIEHLDWRKCLETYDQESACFYLDPPYPHSTRQIGRRGGGGHYAHELSEEEHVELVERILELKGSAAVSGYDHPAYEVLEGHGFERHAFSVCLRAKVGSGTVAQARTEVLWVAGATRSGTLF